MAIVTTDDKYYKDIADAIRNRAYTETPKQYKPSEMAGAVDAVFYAGYEEGHSFGDADGYDRGKAEGAESLYRLLAGGFTEYYSDMGGKIRKHIFSYCDTLVSVNFPNLTETNEYAFFYCQNLTQVSLPQLTKLGANSFSTCQKLTQISLPQLVELGSNSFKSCIKLDSVDLPNVEILGYNAFDGCTGLTSLSLPSATTQYNSTFYNCSKLTFIDLGRVSNVGSYVFQNCYSLKTLILRNNELCTLAATNSFTKCYHILGTTNSTYNPTGAKDGYIYVPQALVESYKTATNWVTYADQFRAIEDYPEITGG